MNNPSNEKNIDKLKQAGLKVTHSRCKILEIFQSFPDEHYTADRLKDLLDDQGENIGLATIYRVLTQLEMAELIQKNNFNVICIDKFNLKRLHYFNCDLSKTKEIFRTIKNIKKNYKDIDV